MSKSRFVSGISFLTAPNSRMAKFGVGAGLMLAVVAGGSAAFAASTTTVTLTVDGEERRVNAFGSSVEQILKSAEVSLGERDSVQPSIDSVVSDGDDVTVRHSRLLSITLDGHAKEHWTYALTVDEALQELQVRADGATLSVSRSTPLGREGLRVEVSTPKQITLVVAGESREITTAAVRVGDVLTEAGINKGELDRISEALEAPVTPGMTITLDRVTVEEKTVDEDVEYKTEKVENPEMNAGDKKVRTPGQPGRATRTYKLTIVNGQVEGREQLKETIHKAPVGAVVEIGTKEVPGTEPGGVWDKLAQCEAGGNWKANTGNGYYGGLQFNAKSWQAVGGTGLPHEHSREVQIQMGERLKAKQGWGAWPACTRKLGLR